MEYLSDSDDPAVSRKSSINQYRSFLGVMKNGMFCPLVFDQLDGIVCGKVHSHPIMVYFGDWDGYHYPVKKCRYNKSTILIGQDIGGSLQILPEQFGRGDCWHNNFYEEKHNRDITMYGDNGEFVGVQVEKELTVGLDYITAEDELEAVD